MKRKVKITGYAKKVFFGNNIELRDFSDLAVGNQTTVNNTNGSFTLGTFIIPGNFLAKKNRIYKSNSFTDIITLEDLPVLDNNVVEAQVSIKKLIDDNYSVFLNLSNKYLNNLAFYGSLSDVFKLSLNEILSNFPGALFCEKKTNDNVLVNDYLYDPVTNESIFSVKVNSIVNPFNVNFYTDVVRKIGYKDFSKNFKLFEVLFKGVVYKILDVKTPKFGNGSKIFLKVSGRAFSNASSIMLDQSFLIKPINDIFNSFYNELSDVSRHLLNRNSVPKFTADFYINSINEINDRVETLNRLTFPLSSDGYNLDIETTSYDNYVNSLFDISRDYDDTFSDYIFRRLVSSSIIEFDTDSQSGGEGKITKLLKTYGSSFDKIRREILNLQYINTVKYNDENTTIKSNIKNLAYTLGFDVFNIYQSKNPLEVLSIDNLGDLDLIEIDQEFWRRLTINAAWLWKSKGTRNALEFMIKFLGIPEEMIDFNEYVYVADSPLDIEKVFSVYNKINGTSNSDKTNFFGDVAIDSSGFPRPKDDIPFQANGGWWRETFGEKSEVDITEGNNPHSGPYDFGGTFLKQFRDIIPGFKPTVIDNVVNVTERVNLFTNNFNGTFDDCLFISAGVSENIMSDGMVSPGDVLPLTYGGFGSKTGLLSRNSELTLETNNTLNTLFTSTPDYPENSYWIDRGIGKYGRLNLVGVWVTPDVSVVNFTYRINVPSKNTYVFGIAADNLFNVNLTKGNSSVNILKTLNIGSTAPYFQYWYLFEIELESGQYFINFEGTDLGDSRAFGAELYDYRSIADIKDLTHNFVTRDSMTGTNWNHQIGFDFIGENYAMDPNQNSDAFRLKLLFSTAKYLETDYYGDFKCGDGSVLVFDGFNPPQCILLNEVTEVNLYSINNRSISGDFNEDLIVDDRFPVYKKNSCCCIINFCDKMLQIELDLSGIYSEVDIIIDSSLPIEDPIDDTNVPSNCIDLDINLLYFKQYKEFVDL